MGNERGITRMLEKHGERMQSHQKLVNDQQQKHRGTDAQSKDNYRHLVPRAKSEHQKR